MVFIHRVLKVGIKRIEVKTDVQVKILLNLMYFV
jgi:hypothetical protein